MNKSSRWPVTLLIAAASVAISLWPGAAMYLEFSREAVAGGEWWRLLTGHLTHFGLNHLAWDVTVFAVLGILCERRSRMATLACLGIAAVLIPVAVWILAPQIATYRGLSGLDTALFALLGVMMLAEKRREGSRAGMAVIGLLLLGMAGKIGWEFVTGDTMFAHSAGQFTPVPLAHLVGAAIGLSFWFIRAPADKSGEAFGCFAHDDELQCAAWSRVINVKRLAPKARNFIRRTGAS